MDAPDTVHDVATSKPKPMFNFPKEPRGFTAADLIALLKMYNREFEGNAPIISCPGYSREDYLVAAYDALCPDPFHKRSIFRRWPRSPTGKPIRPTNSLKGKETPNGIQLWGATMFDFYRVQRFPDISGLLTITTGSKLLRWMKANGELDAAKDEIEWAEHEEGPKIIEPYPLRNLIENEEVMIRIRVLGEPMFKNDKDKMGDSEVDHSFFCPSRSSLTKADVNLPFALAPGSIQLPNSISTDQITAPLSSKDDHSPRSLESSSSRLVQPLW